MYFDNPTLTNIPQAGYCKNVFASSRATYWEGEKSTGIFNLMYIQHINKWGVCRTKSKNTSQVNFKQLAGTPGSKRNLQKMRHDKRRARSTLSKWARTCCKIAANHYCQVSRLGHVLMWCQQHDTEIKYPPWCVSIKVGGGDVQAAAIRSHCHWLR